MNQFHKEYTFKQKIGYFLSGFFLTGKIERMLAKTPFLI